MDEQSLLGTQTAIEPKWLSGKAVNLASIAEAGSLAVSSQIVSKLQPRDRKGKRICDKDKERSCRSGGQLLTLPEILDGRLIRQMCGRIWHGFLFQFDPSLWGM